MDPFRTKGPVAGNGLNKAAPLQPSAPARHAPNDQRAMLQTARADVTGFLINLIGNRRDEVAYRLYPHLAPAEAVETLLRNLRGKERRKIGVHEMDTILDVLGDEAEESWFRFSMKRRGIVPPDAFERADDLARLRAKVEDALRRRERADHEAHESDGILAETLEHIKALEARR